LAAGNTPYQLGTVVKEHMHKAVGHDESNRAGIAFETTTNTTYTDEYNIYRRVQHIQTSTTYTDELYMIDAGSSGLSLHVAEQILVVNVIEQANEEKRGRDTDA